MIVRLRTYLCKLQLNRIYFNNKYIILKTETFSMRNTSQTDFEKNLIYFPGKCICEFLFTQFAMKSLIVFNYVPDSVD